jgi:hypothetical protein
MRDSVAASTGRLLGRLTFTGPRSEVGPRFTDLFPFP